MDQSSSREALGGRRCSTPLCLDASACAVVTVATGAIRRFVVQAEEGLAPAVGVGVLPASFHGAHFVRWLDRACRDVAGGVMDPRVVDLVAPYR